MTKNADFSAQIASCRIAFCCEGNTCRSKMAQEIWNARYFSFATADSFGFSANGKTLTHPAVIAALKKGGIEAVATPSTPLSHLTEATPSTPLSHLTEGVEECANALPYAAVVCATRTQKILLSAFAKERALTVYAAEELIGRDIADPFGESDATYDALFTQTEQLCEVLAQKLGFISGDKAAKEKFMKIAIGCDHGGYAYKQTLSAHLQKKGITVEDKGCYNTSSCDYPDYALPVAEAVAKKQCDLGVIICGTGIGVSIVANKVPGVRASLCHDVFSAKATRVHNDSNVLCMGARVIGEGLMLEIVDAYLSASFEGGRHQARLDKIAAIEQKYSK
ncbi:MAG: ribose 5-phosphate isomerase B [Clostridia bacterium]|nr:ribose 5-phosphate isomerase B [Clostridia bacterium]